MQNMRPLHLAIPGLAFAVLVAPAAAAGVGDTNAGAALFRRADCNVCHAKIMNGDGNAIFTRPARIVTSAEALAKRVHVCAQVAHAGWSAAEESDVAAYLDASFYHFTDAKGKPR